jgi:hypothetical protein
MLLCNQIRQKPGPECHDALELPLQANKHRLNRLILNKIDATNTNQEGSLIRTAASSLSKTYLFDPLKDPRWDRFLSMEARSSIFHAKAWLLALNRTYGDVPVGYTFAADGEESQNAVVFCRIKSWLTGNRLVSIPFSDHCEPSMEWKISTCGSRLRKKNCVSGASNISTSGR